MGATGSIFARAYRIPKTPGVQIVLRYPFASLELSVCDLHLPNVLTFVWEKNRSEQLPELFPSMHFVNSPPPIYLAELGGISVRHPNAADEPRS